MPAVVSGGLQYVTNITACSCCVAVGYGGFWLVTVRLVSDRVRMIREPCQLKQCLLVLVLSACWSAVLSREVTPFPHWLLNCTCSAAGYEARLCSWLSVTWNGNTVRALSVL